MKSHSRFCLHFVCVLYVLFAARRAGVADREKGARQLRMEPRTWRVLAFIGLPSARLVKGTFAGDQPRLISYMYSMHRGCVQRKK